MNSQNPYDTFAGVFVPHFVLSARRASLGAKILFSLLASGADIRGESLLNTALMAAKMGVDEGTVLELVDELVDAWLIKVRQDPAGTEFFSCHFPPNAWREDNLPRSEKVSDLSPRTVPRLLKLPTSTVEGSSAASNSSIPVNELQPENQVVNSVCSKKNPASQFPKEVCIEYVKARRQCEGKIDNPYALGTALWKSGDGDEEILLWLQSKESDESAA